MEKSLLEFHHVTGTSKKFALQDVSFTLPTGYLMGLAGKNGAGKTTLMNYIMSRKRHYTGNICIEGEDIRAEHSAMLGKIGFVSEEVSFFEERTVQQNAELLGRFYNNFDMAVMEETLEKMQISMRKTIGGMSRGEYLRFQMAFAMAHRPVLYLLDEVTAGMDPVFRLDFFKLLHEIIAHGTASVLMTSHIEEEIDRNMDYVGILENGRLISFGEAGGK